MAFFTSLWKARIIEQCKRDYENEKYKSILASNTEIPCRTIRQKWRLYRHDTKTRMTGKLRKWFPEGSTASNLYFYLKTDQTFPNFVMKSVIGFLGGIVLTYLCFMFFVFQLAISLIHATIMSSVIGVMLTLGLAFSYRIRCLVFLLIPQLFSRVGRYTLTCYALVLILTGPATNTFKNSEVLSESMACSQEQIKTSVRQINESVQKPFNSMKDSIKIMVDTMKRLTSKLNEIVSKLCILIMSIADVIQTSLSWLSFVADGCTKKIGTPFDYCVEAINRGVRNCKNTFGGELSWLCNASSAAKSACLTIRPYSSICFVADYATASFAATLKRKLRVFTNRINTMFLINVETQHTYTFNSNASNTASQVAAGIVTEIRNRADPLLTWLSWSSCVTSLFFLLIIFRAKYYQHMFETRSRFDNRYVTRELRELDLKRWREGRETILPLNRREQAKYITVISFRLVTTEKLYLTRSMVFMTITTFKLLIHIVADYTLYWILMTVRYHGRFQTSLPPGPSDAGVHIAGHGIVADFIRSIFDSLTIPLIPKTPSPVTCLPNPYPPDFQRYTQIGVLIILLWFFALFEPYGLRLRHVIMGHYRPERAKTRAVWLYYHILRTRGSFMKLARRKLHRDYKYSDHETFTFRYWVNSIFPGWCLRYILGILPKERRCLLCNTNEEKNESDTKLISCESPKCPGVYCTRCYSDIGCLCTICLTPNDYGDLSDVSLEKGSSDEDNDQESQDDENNFVVKRLTIYDDERKGLLRKSDTQKNSKRTIAPQGNSNQPQDDILIVAEKRSEDIYSKDLKTVDKLLNTKDIITRTMNQSSMCDDIEMRFQKNICKPKIIYNVVHELSGFFCKKSNDNKIKNIFLTIFILTMNNNVVTRPVCRKLKLNKNLQKLRRKRKITNNKYNIISRLLGAQHFISYLKIAFSRFIYSKLCKYSCKSNIHNVKTAGKMFQVIKKRSKTFGQLKRKRNKPWIQNKIYIKVRRRKFCIQTILKQISHTGKSKSCGNNCIVNLVKLTDKVNCPNKLSPLNNDRASKDAENKRVFKKTFKNNKETVRSKNCSYKARKFCGLCTSCFIIFNTNVEANEMLNKEKCAFSNYKGNFKRRKKKSKEIKTDNADKSLKIKEENVNSRNYRLSSYLIDQTWIKQKFCRDQTKDRFKTETALNDLANQLEVADHKINGAESLKIIKKTFSAIVRKYCCPLDVCICKGNPENAAKAKSEKKKSFFGFRKKNCCKYIFSNNSESNAKNRKSLNALRDPFTVDCPSSESPDTNYSRSTNFHTSLGNRDIKIIGEIPKIDDICLGDRNNLSTETITMHSNIMNSSKNKSSKRDNQLKFDFDKLSTSIKSMKIKDIKLIKNPLPMIRDLYCMLLEASSKNRKGKNDRKQKMKDAETEVLKQTCTCGTQYKKTSKDKTCSCMQLTKSTDEFGDTVNIDECSSELTISGLTLSTFSLSEDTKTDTTACSRVAIDYEVSPRRVKPKKNVRKIKIDYITKTNRGTATEKAKLCDVSTITSDWWSPIIERKVAKEYLGKTEIDESRKQRKRSNKDRSVSTDGRIVTFMSRAQIIPRDTRDILSPSRYLLESQKYYNELFSSNYYSPRVVKNLKNYDERCSSRDGNGKDERIRDLFLKTDGLTPLDHPGLLVTAARSTKNQKIKQNIFKPHEDMPY